MKKINQFTATALALSLCLALTACSSDDTGDSTPDTNTETTTPDTTTTPPVNEDNEESSDHDAGSSNAVTYESYLMELTTFTENFMGLQEPFTAAATAFSEDYTNPEAIAGYVASLNHMIAKFGEINKITPTEDMADTHQNFVESCFAVSATMNSMIEILEDDFANAGQEALDEYNALFTGDYQTTYSEFATNIFAVADEIQAKMG